MAKPEVVLPPVVREKAAQLGNAGAAWLSGLPALINYLERRWSVTIGEPLNGGTASYVARTRTADGTDTVVKLSVPDPAFTRQIRTLAAARGRGYVRLLAHDEENYAVLLEALGSPLNHLGLSPEVQIDTLCDMLPAAWQVPPPTSPNAEPALDKARSLADLVARLWQDLGHPARSGSPSTPLSARSAARPRSTRTVASSSMVMRHPPTPSRYWHPGRARSQASCSSTPTGFSAIPPTTSVWSCVTGAPNCSQVMRHR